MRYALGLKEQAIVCEALGRGLQTVAIRKGGIEDLDDAERLQIPERPFLLLPARFHEGEMPVHLGFRERLRDHLPRRFEGQFQVHYGATVVSETFVESADALVRLAPLQAFTEDELRKRFAYRTPGVHVLTLRAYRLRDAIFVPDSPETAGCRSWIELPEPHACESVPVLTDDTFAEQAAAVAAILNC